MNDVLISNYKSSLRSLFNSDEFANLDSSKIGVAVNSLNNDFRSAFPDIGSEEEASINTISDEMLTEYKNKAEIPRFIPKPEEFELYYGSQAPDLSTAKNAEDKIAIIDKWKEDGLKKSSDLIPSQTDDFKTHLDYLSNSFIRQAVSDDNKTGWLSDKGYRAVEGAMSMVTPFIPGADRFLAENLPENTGMDEDISSLLFSGAGQLVSQAAIALGASAVAGPEAGVAAIGTIYSARALVEGYKEEMRKSGNPDKALDVGLAGIPGAQLETFADSFLLGMFGGHGGKIAFEAFQKATTRAAKEAVIKAAIPSLGKKALQAGLVEASVGAAGADFTTGYGRYLASGDESYIPTAEQLAKGALVEGLLGAGYTTAFNRPTTEMSNVAKDLKTFSQDKANADDIFKALKSKNYDLAVELATKDYANQPEKKTEASKIISDGLKAPSDEAKEKATSPILPNHRLVLKTKLKELEKAGDTESAKRISDTLKSVNDGSFTAPESFGLEAVASNFEPTDTPVSVGDGNTVTLKDGTEVESDESLIYVKGISTSSAIVHNVTNNGVGILLDGSDKASLVFGNKTKTGGFSFSQTPKVGYTAVKVNGVHGDSKGNFIVSNFSILGEVAGAKKSEAAKQKTQAVVDKFKQQKPVDEEAYKNSGINDALLVLDTLTATETLSDAGYAEVEKTVLDTLEKLETYANNNPSEAAGVEDIQNELWDAIPQFKSKVKEAGPTLPVRENVDLFQQRIAEQAKLEQQELEIPVQVKDLAGRYVTYQGNGGVLNVSGGMAYVGDIEVSGSEALIQDVEGLSEVVTKKELPVKKEPVIEEEVPDSRGYKVKYDRYGAWKIFDDGSMKHIPRGKQKKANKNTKAEVVEVKPTVEAIVATPEAVFTSIVEDVVIESTIEDEVAPAVATLESLKEDLVKKQASLASVKSEKFKNTINKKIATIEKEIALLESSGAKDIPTAVQQIKEEIVEQKKTEPVKTKEKPGIKPGQLAAVDIESTNKKDADGNHLFTAKGKSYSVKNNKAKGWHLSSGENFIFLGKTKEEAKVKLASELNNDPNFGSEYVTSEKSNTEILKAVTFTPPKPESVDEKIARLNKAADDADNKVISDKVDAHIATIENETAKKKWSDNKDLIVKFFKATLTDPKNNRTEEFLSLGDVVLKRVEALASELDSKVANQIKKDQSERKTVSEQEKQHLKRVDEENARLKDVAKSVGIRYSISSSAPETSISQEEAQEYIDANGFNVNIEDTQEVTEDGHQWNGRVDFRSGTPVITVNIANISSVEQLRNVINEELGHVAYNVPQIAEILGKIKDTTKLRDEIKDLYKQSDLYEESVVKRMADLVDSYSEKGMFDKLVTAIKSYVKDKLGMELSDADLSYIAYRAINKASKVTKANKNIESKFSYAGEKAEMPQMMRDSLETAKAMAASGKTSEEIRAFTGWFPGKYDGKMRFEVPDNDIKINNEKFKELKVNDSFLMRFGIYEGGISLDQILEGNSKLLDTYPELKNVLIYRVDQYENASFNPGKNAIILPSNSKNSLLHEIQHFIQLKEGFSTGGNASAKFLVNAMSFDKFTSYFNIENMKSGEALMKVFNKLNALRLYKELDNKEKKAILDGDFGKGFDRVKGKNLINKLKDKYGISSSVVSIYDINSNGGVDSYYENESKVFSKLYEEVKEEAAKKLDQSPLSKNALYKSIAGEIESRDVENRSNLTDEQRKIIAPYSSENISKEDAIESSKNERIGVSEIEKLHLKRVEEEERQLKEFAGKVGIRYSISSSIPETSISQEVAQEYIDINKLNVNIEDTQEVTEDGHQWNGRVDFRSGTPVITVNIANISSVEQLRNVINEELGHVAYNVPQIAEMLGKIKDTTKLRDEIKDLYKQSDLYEESVVKRMADLVDSYSEKGMFDKLVTAIKSYVKDKLGMELNNSDLSYIAYRAINKASKVTKANKNIESKFSYAGEKAEMPQMMRDSLETAKAMAASGKTSEEIRALTGWFPGKYDGKMRFEIPDNNVNFTEKKSIKVFDPRVIPVKKDGSKYSSDTGNNNPTLFAPFIRDGQGGTILTYLVSDSKEGAIKLWRESEGIDEDGYTGGYLSGKLEHVINYPSLFEAYPDARNINVSGLNTKNSKDTTNGLYSKNKIKLNLFRSEEQIKSTLLHEIQHWIQEKEGFARGSNPENFSFVVTDVNDKEKLRDISKSLRKHLDAVDIQDVANKYYGGKIEDVVVYAPYEDGALELAKKESTQSLLENIKKIRSDKSAIESKYTKHSQYRKVAGEIESRDVQYRQNFTEDQRKAVEPYDSENISKEDAIIIFKNGENSDSVNTSTDLDGYTETPDIFSVLTNNITTEQRETFKKIQKMLRKKLEKKLIVDEPAAWSVLKSIKFGFLKNEELKEYNDLLDEFVRTRSKNRDPKSDVRDSAQTVIAKASELAKKANQGHFDFLQMKHEFLEDKDFTNDYQGDIDLVMQLAKDDRGHKDSDLPSDKDGETLQTWQIRTLELQDLIFDNLDYVNDRLEEMFPSSNISTSNPILSKYLKVFQNNVDEVIAKQKEMFKSRMNQLMSDPTDKSYRDLRKQYFGLMDFLSDGYALNIEDFITQETADALATKLEDKDIMDMHKAPWRKKWLAGASSFYANTRMLGSKVADITSKLTNNFRSGIMAAERIHDEFTKPVLKEMYESAVAENGGKDFNGQEHNHAGIYSMARAFKSTEGVTEGILNSKRSIQTSIEKDIESVWSGRKKAAKDHLEFLNNLFIGITKDTPNEEALGILEANAEKILPKGLISYVKGINELFEATKPLAKFTSEFGLGRPFEEWVNYTPSLAITKEGQPIEFDVTEMSVNVSSDESVHGDLNKDTNMQRSGGGSMKDRTRRLGNSMVYVFNINHLAENRMRLNLIDYLTLQQRRELNNVISGNGTKHKEFAKLLKDEDGGKERVSHLQTTVRTMWSNTIQSASFISEFQAGVNVFSNMWASGKLASLYQFPGQIASNLAPYFVVNSGNPKRIKYLFDAMGILLKKQMGHTLEPRLDKVVSRVLSTVHGRSQEQFLDKSIALDVNSSDVWQKVKTSSFWSQIKGINKIREKILFSQFIYSDMMTGAPMMLANMMAHEEAAGRVTSWDGLTFNDESFIKSVDEAERFVGIGASSRRGVWTNNKNGYLVTLRNMLSAFSSHRVNNATNFAIELAKVNDSNTTSEEKAQSVRYMLGIQAQSVVFSVIKWGMVGAFYNLLTASMGDEENEDELEKKYRKLLTDKNISKEQKLTIQAEISMLQKIRNEYEKVKEKNNSYEVLVVRGLQDMVSNSFLIPAATDIPVNALIHNTYDKWEAMRFNEVKESELKQLNEKLKKAKDNKNTSLVVELQKDISRWESQEAIAFVYEGQSLIPFDGVYGGVMKDAAKFVDSASSALLKAEPMSIADIFLGTGIVGLSQPELNKIARLYSKKEEYEQEYKEKIEEIKSKPYKDRK